MKISFSGSLFGGFSPLRVCLKTATLALFSILFAVQMVSAKAGQNDPTFLGKVFNDTASLTARKIIAQPDGKLLVLSDLNVVGGKIIRNRLFRLNQDGTLDTSFTYTQNPDVLIRDMALTSDGRLFITGSFSSFGSVSTVNVARLNSDGSTDPTFVVASFSANATSTVLGLQPDGKLIAAGSFTSVSGSTRNSIVRFNADGSVDTTFNPNAGPNAAITSMSLQSDGKIVLGGEFTSFAGNSRNRIARLNADGSLDTGFSVGTGPNSTSNLGLTSQPDGKILVTGSFSTFNGLSRSYVVRLLTNGAVDTAFATPFNTSSTVQAAKVLPDGRILLVGTFNTVFGQSVSNYVRLNADGTRDTTLNVLGSDSSIRAIETDSSGNILLGGGFNAIGATTRRKMARLDSTGVLDLTFNPDLRRSGFSVTALAVQPDDKVIIAGDFTAVGEINRAGLARLNADGSLDTTFSPGTGVNNPGSILAIAIQPDGKILIGGRFTAYNGTSLNRIARLNANGSLDSSFVIGTGIIGNGLSTSVSVYSMALQPDGKILASGAFTQYNGIPSNGIVRLNSNGTFDSTFQTGTGLGFEPIFIGYGVAVDADGKVIVGGRFTNYNGTTVSGLVRLSPTGALDTAFQANIGSATDGFQALAISIDQNGKILIGGAFPTFNQQLYRGLVRLNSNGTIDSTFTPGTTTGTVVYQVLPLPNGKVVISGEFTQVGNNARVRIAQLNNDGSVDGSFVTGSGLSIAAPGNLLVRQGSKLLIGGEFNSYNGMGVTPLLRLRSSSNASTPGQFRPTNGFVYLRNSNDTGFANFEFFYGQAGDIPVAGDWNGDGIDTVGIYRNGTFFLRNSNNTGFADLAVPFGGPGDIPVVGDWDGDGIDTIGIVRGNTVFLRNSNTTGFADIQFAYGNATDIFIVGDWNGDGIDTIGAFRPTNGFVYLRNSNTTGVADIEFFYGTAGDKPVAGDWNADGIDTIGIVRGNQWLLRNSNSTGFADLGYFYGTADDTPITGDWDGN